MAAQDKEGEPASPVVAIGWSLNGRRVVTAEEKGRIRLWNVETGGVVYSCVLESISLTVQISPGDANTVLACPNAGGASVLAASAIARDSIRACAECDCRPRPSSRSRSASDRPRPPQECRC